MKAGSIYYHFDSKEEILDVILDQGVREIFDGVKAELQSSEAESDYRVRIAGAVKTHLALILERSEFTSVNIRIYSQLPEEIRERHYPLRRAYAELWDTLLIDAQMAGQLREGVDIAPLRQFLLGALNWTAEWFDGEKHSVATVAARYADLILYGISAETGDAPG